MVTGAGWGCRTQDTCQQEHPSPTISSHPHGPLCPVDWLWHCWQVFAALSVCMEPVFAEFTVLSAVPATPEHEGIQSPFASGTVPHPLSLAGCGAAGTVCSGCKGQPLLGWGRSALLILHHHQQAAPWKGQLCNGCIYKDTRHLLSVLVRCHKPPPKNK